MKGFLLSFLLLLCACGSYANNVQISNVSIINGGTGQIQVQCTITWDNSWRTNVGQNNYDGVWVFFKYKNLAGNWVHATMTGANNVVPSGFDVYQTNDFLKIGAMVYREPANLGSGTSTCTNLRLGLINTLPYNIDVKGFAIEMVFVPAPTTRPFFGDGNGTSESPNALHYSDNTATTGSVVPMLCDANGFDDADLDADGIYVYSNDTIQKTNPLGTLDPFPTMKAQWCMKYEVSQAQYRDFLNTLSFLQQAARTVNAPNSATGTGAMGTAGASRQYIEIATPGVNATTPAVYGCDASGNNVYDEAGDGEWVACGNLIWPDLAAYLDWSGLAPMSELQYERFCRGHSSSGPQPAIFAEFAWGTTTVFGSAYTLSVPATANEVALNASASVGNAVDLATSAGVGPDRTGIFAIASSDRVRSGASFFGIMEMTGNVEEYVIHIGSAAGRSCRFVPNGSGSISANGFAQLSVGGAGFWPGMEGNNIYSANNTCAGTCEVTGYAGMVTRGGSYNTASSSMAMCNRNFILPNLRFPYRGGRGVLYVR